MQQQGVDESIHRPNHHISDVRDGAACRADAPQGANRVFLRRRDHAERLNDAQCFRDAAPDRVQADAMSHWLLSPSARSERLDLVQGDPGHVAPRQVLRK